MKNNISPVISVVVPVYNAEQYLHQCIDSILNQTFTDFELILVDDGSQDNSGAICDQYAEKDNRIIVIHQENKGQAAARNVAISKAKGEWIHFVDSDDLIHPQMLEILYTAAMNEKCDMSVCMRVSQDKLPLNFFQEQQLNVCTININEVTLKKLFFSDTSSYWVVWAKLIKKAIVASNLFTEGKIFEDNAVVCKWLYDANKIAMCNNVMYFYRTENSSTVRSAFSIKKLDYLWALEEQILFYKHLRYEDMIKLVINTHIDFAISKLKFIENSKQLRIYKYKITSFYLKNNLLKHLTKDNFKTLIKIVRL